MSHCSVTDARAYQNNEQRTQEAGTSGWCPLHIRAFTYVNLFSRHRRCLPITISFLNVEHLYCWRQVGDWGRQEEARGRVSGCGGWWREAVLWKNKKSLTARSGWNRKQHHEL
eukprot:scaffold7760_cov180-Alexandrium_tamarense.AAC.1